MSSFFDFRDNTDLDFLVDEAVEGVVVVFEIPEAIPTDGVAPGIPEATFTDGVAPGIPEATFADGVAPGIDGNVVGDKGTSGSLGKLSVYKILAGLLHRKPTDVIRTSIREKRRKSHCLFSTP